VSTFPAVKESLTLEEGRISWLYLDTKGFTTCAIGHRVPSLQACLAIHWQLPSGAAAGGADIAQAWNAVKFAKPGLRANAYKRYCPLMLPDSEIDALYDADESLIESELAKSFRFYPTFPEPVRQALTDMSFNLGEAGLIQKFPKLTEAVIRGDWATAAAECERQDVSADRNTRTRQLFLSAVTVAA
jgi:GH24 family phage-related lysozyme (muramidase)